MNRNLELGRVQKICSDGNKFVFGANEREHGWCMMEKEEGDGVNALLGEISRQRRNRRLAEGDTFTD